MADSSPLAARSSDLDRHIALEQALNFRDIGGYETADGRSVRWRRVFRAGGLSELTPADLEILRELGITTVVDLRSTAEWTTDRFPVEDFPVTHHHLPVVEQILDPTRYDAPEGMMEVRYQEMASTGATPIARAISVVADAETHPVVVHCLAGKDRTGIVVALILALLGVDDERVAEDYALSNLAMVALRAKAEASDEERVIRSEALLEEVFSARPSNITALFAKLRADYGSVEEYAVASGVRPEEIGALREALLE
jgi:protein tyrosine/serine phosphatase